MKSFGILIVVISGLLQAQSGNVTMDGENAITFTGKKFTNAKLAFAKVSADWFVADKDAHATISLHGVYDGRQTQLDIELDGKKDEHRITYQNIHEAQRIYEFIFTATDKEVYGDGFDAKPADNDSDAVIVRVISIDDRTLKLNFSGRVTYSDDGPQVMTVEGNVSMHKNVVPMQNFSGKTKPRPLRRPVRGVLDTTRSQPPMSRDTI